MTNTKSGRGKGKDANYTVRERTGPKGAGNPVTVTVKRGRQSHTYVVNTDPLDLD